MMQWLINKIKSDQRILSFIKDAELWLKPIIAYLENLSLREKQLLGGCLIIIAVTGIFLFIGGMLDLQSSLEQQYAQNKKLLLNAQFLSKEFQDLGNLHAEQFATIDSDKITEEIKQVADLSQDDNPAVNISDNVLHVELQQVKFSNVVILLDQLKTSYGLFPNTLQIIKSNQDGYVYFNASFIMTDK